MSEKDTNLFSISCPKCGSCLSYDIAEREYCCKGCGESFGAEDVRKHLMDEYVMRSVNVSSVLSAQILEMSVYRCPKCGGVRVVGGGDSRMCVDCGCELERMECKAADFPKFIIPFTISRAEAVGIAEAWLKSRRRTKTIDKILESLYVGMESAYLPFVLTQGDFVCRVNSLELPGCVYGMFVSLSKQMNNSLLDAVEPFVRGEMRDFDLSYIEKYKAVMPEIGGKMLRNRRDHEIEGNYKPSINKALGQSFRLYSVEKDDNMVSNNVLLPMYTLSIDGTHVLAVNGQTGRVAYIENEEIHGSDEAFAPDYNLTLMNRERVIEEYGEVDFSWRDMLWNRHIDAINCISSHWKLYSVAALALLFLVRLIFHFDNIYNPLVLYLAPLVMYIPTFVAQKPTVYIFSSSIGYEKLRIINRENRKSVLRVWLIYALIGVCLGALIWWIVSPKPEPKPLTESEIMEREYYIGFRTQHNSMDTTGRVYYWENVSGSRHNCSYSWFRHSNEPGFHTEKASGYDAIRNINYTYLYNFDSISHPKFELVMMAEVGAINVVETDKVLFDSTEYLYSTDYFFCRQVDDVFELLPPDDSTANALLERYKRWCRKKGF